VLTCLLLAAGLAVVLVHLKAGADVFGAPYSLEEQGRFAESAGFTIVPAPDAPGEGDQAPDIDAASRAAGAALFIRDYSLPIYPEGRVVDRDLEAPAAVDAARGQTEPLSLGVHAIEALSGVSVEVSALTRDDGATLPAPRVRILEPAYIRQRGPEGEKQAALTHLRLWPNRPFDVPAGQNRQVWIEVTVPAEAGPGAYRGLITVRSSGRPTVSRDLTVRVRAFELVEPDDFFLGAFMTLRPFIPNRETLADFKAHGIDAMLWFWSETVWTVYREGDTIRQHFHPLMRVVEDAMAVGMKGPIVIGLGNDTHGFYEKRLCREFNRPLRPAEPVDGKTAQVAPIDDDVINRLYIEGIRQLLEVAERHNWPEIIILHYDEPTERLMPEATHRYRQLKEAFPNLRIYGVTMNTLEWARDLAPISDILVCNGSFAEIRDLGRDLGKPVWGYSGATAVTGAGGSRFNMGLRLWPYGFGARWFWCYNFYCGDPWNEFDGNPGDADWVTVYPGRTAGDHVPTLAWEGIRLGYDDVRYCATLVRLLNGRRGEVRDRIAADYKQFLADIPTGRDRTSFGVDQDNFYATLPAYDRLTDLRRKLVEWIEALLTCPR